MALFAVQRQGARLSVQAQAAIVVAGGETIVKKPLHEIDEVHLYGDVELTALARTELLRRGIDVLFLSERGGYLGRLVGATTGSAERRVAQLRWLLDPTRALGLAQSMVRAKLELQRGLLQRVARRDPERAHPAAIAALRVLLDRVATTQDADELRGVEGQGAALYYRGIASAIGDARFRFERRRRRPPTDPINACLSFGYTLLCRKVESALMRAGLDVGFGALHGATRGKPALALDLMEPWRVLVVDRLVLRLINRRQLDPLEDFEDPGVDLDRVSDAEADEPSDGPACYLAERGRTVFLRAWAELWRDAIVYPPREARFELGAILAMQAVELAQVFEGERAVFEPFVPR